MLVFVNSFCIVSQHYIGYLKSINSVKMIRLSSTDYPTVRSERVVKFSNVQELNRWLLSHGIDTAVWGQQGHKTVENLWKELATGDALMQENPPMRLVNVVQVLVRRGNEILLETIQEMASGHKRYRNLPPAEKIKFGENFLNAATRGLKEELGISAENIDFDVSSHTKRTFISESPSYPGLLSQYTFHDIEATVQGLPECDFWFDNLAYTKGDPVKRHFWSWSPTRERNAATSTLDTGPLQSSA